jgi:DNA-binding MarR family transcriptional regulator
VPGTVVDESTAVRLTVALQRLRARLREEAGTSATGLSISQLTILQRLLAGPATAATLAAAEHVSQQAIAQILTTLKAAGLVRSKPDPADGRKVLLSVTASGRRLVEAMVASRDAWLVRAIDATVADDERPALAKAIELLERLAGAHPATTGRRPGPSS